GHWEIENRLHWVRDVTFDEDRCQIRTGQGARTMATLRNLAISVFRLRGCRNIARALRQTSWNAQRAMEWIGA
ncbi:MAG: transposase, partial [Alicyclobacillus sp.]|nr:transposase [Alicyclobacillus sp.]